MSPREAAEKITSGRDNYNIKSQTVRHRPKNEIIKVNTFYQYKSDNRSKINNLAIKEEQDVSFNKSLTLKSPYAYTTQPSYESKPSIKNSLQRK